jgi:sulfate-transporting ATPase
VAGITSVSGGILAGIIGSGGVLVALISSRVGNGGVDNWYGIVAGIGVILTVIFNPDGLVGPAHSFMEQRRIRGMLARPETALVASRQTTPGAQVRAPIPASTLAPVQAKAGELVGSSIGVESNGHTRMHENGKTGPLLEVRNLTVRYGGVLAVDDVSFDVEAGQIVGLIGPNGAGKTTTIDALCGFHHYEGSVVLAGQGVDGYSPHRRAALGLARTFQLAGVADDLTVEENVQVGQHMAVGHEPVTRILDELGLVDMRELQVSMLSQGQRQLVSVARALAGKPRLLLLDEPAAGLDSTESLWLAERLRSVAEAGVTILLVDHDMSLVLNLCDRIAVLDFGALIATGMPDEIRKDQRVSTAYLGATHQRLVQS